MRSGSYMPQSCQEEREGELRMLSESPVCVSQPKVICSHFSEKSASLEGGSWYNKGLLCHICIFKKMTLYLFVNECLEVQYSSPHYVTWRTFFIKNKERCCEDRHIIFSLCSDKLFSLRGKVLDPGLNHCPVLIGCNTKIIKTVLGRMFLSISWLKWCIVAYSTIALYVFFYKEQICPHLALFLFVWLLINTEVKSLPRQMPLWSFREGKEGKVRGSAMGLGYRLHGEHQGRAAQR